MGTTADNRLWIMKRVMAKLNEVVMANPHDKQQDALSQLYSDVQAGKQLSLDQQVLLRHTL